MCYQRIWERNHNTVDWINEMFCRRISFFNTIYLCVRGKNLRYFLSRLLCKISFLLSRIYLLHFNSFSILVEERSVVWEKKLFVTRKSHIPSQNQFQMSLINTEIFRLDCINEPALFLLYLKWFNWKWMCPIHHWSQSSMELTH